LPRIIDPTLHKCISNLSKNLIRKKIASGYTTSTNKLDSDTSKKKLDLDSCMRKNWIRVLVPTSKLDPDTSKKKLNIEH